MTADQQNGTWKLAVTAFAETWVPLPGSKDAWPINVQADGQAIVVVERNERPAVHLPPGRHELSGEFKWDQMPQRILVPQEVGILSLSVAGEAIGHPTWDANGQVWLKRIRTEEAEKDLLAVQVYRVIEDGIPTWLLTDIELTVSGKSREEDLGWILPAGFRLSTVDSPLPVAVDDVGKMKAQVRAGKWTISARAFRAANVSEVQFADEAEPLANLELVGYGAKPEFRLAEIEGLETIDVTQTTFPEKWRRLPVYRWDTSSAFQLTEKMRGMGLQRPEGPRWLPPPVVEDPTMVTSNDPPDAAAQVKPRHLDIQLPVPSQDEEEEVDSAPLCLICQGTLLTALTAFVLV